MKFITRKNSMTRKILIILLVVLILIFSITPNYSVQAVESQTEETDRVNEEDLPDDGNGIIKYFVDESNTYRINMDTLEIMTDLYNGCFTGRYRYGIS